MRCSTIRAFMGVALLALALPAQDVTYNFDQLTDFAKFENYKWVEIKDALQPNQLLDQQIKAALDAELAKKGLVKVDGDHADLYIAYQLALGQEKQVNAYNMGRAGWGYGARWGGASMTTATTSTINIGMLVLDLYEPAARQLVWRGKASKALDEKVNPEKRHRNY